MSQKAYFVPKLKTILRLNDISKENNKAKQTLILI